MKSTTETAGDNLYRAIVLYFEGQDDNAHKISDALFQYEVTLRERGVDPTAFCGLEGKSA